MQIHVNTDNNISNNERLAEHVQTVMDGTIGRFSDQITRLDVHINDVNAGKGGADDKRCFVEARLAGLPPVVATHFAGSVVEAIDGAADKLLTSLDKVTSKRFHH